MLPPRRQPREFVTRPEHSCPCVGIWRHLAAMMDASLPPAPWTRIRMTKSAVCPDCGGKYTAILFRDRRIRVRA